MNVVTSIASSWLLLFASCPSSWGITRSHPHTTHHVLDLTPSLLHSCTPSLLQSFSSFFSAYFNNASRGSSFFNPPPNIVCTMPAVALAPILPPFPAPVIGSMGFIFFPLFSR